MHGTRCDTSTYFLSMHFMFGLRNSSYLLICSDSFILHLSAFQLTTSVTHCSPPQWQCSFRLSFWLIFSVSCTIFSTHYHTHLWFDMLVFTFTERTKKKGLMVAIQGTFQKFRKTKLEFITQNKRSALGHVKCMYYHLLKLFFSVVWIAQYL